MQHRITAVAERLDGGLLAHDRGAHDAVLVHLEHAVDDGGGAAGVTDAEARHREGLRETVEEDRALAHARQRGDRDVIAFEGELGVDLVGSDQQVLLDGELGDGLELGAIGGAAGRVGREVQDEQLAAGLPGGAQGGRIERELVGGDGADRDGLGVAERDARSVAHVAGLVVEDLVAGVERRAQEDIERLGDADGPEDLGLGIVFRTVITGDVARDLLAELLGAAVVRVGSATLLKRSDRGLADMIRRDEVRLADAERDRVLHLGDDGEEIADARLGQGRDMPRHETSGGIHGQSGLRG